MRGQTDGPAVIRQVNFCRNFGALAGNIKAGHGAEGGLTTTKTGGIDPPASPESGNDARPGDDYPVAFARWLG